MPLHDASYSLVKKSNETIPDPMKRQTSRIKDDYNILATSTYG